MKYVNIIELVKITSGISPSSVKFEEGGTHPYFKVNDLNENGSRLINTNNGYFNDGALIKANSIVFPKRGASIFTNKVSILAIDSMIDTNLMALSVVGDNYNYELLYQYIKYFGLYKIADTSSIPQINNVHFEGFKVPMFSISTQNLYAKLLSSIDDLIGQSLQLENLYQLKKKKYMQLMLNDISPKFRFKGYTKEWNKYSVSDKYTVIQGLTYKSSDENPDGNINILRSNAIYNSKLKLENIVKINATNIDNIKFVEQGDVLICLSNGSKNLVGKTAIIDQQLENFVHGAFMGVVRGENSLFFHYLMNSSSGQKAISTSMGSTINNISKGNLEKFEFYFPEIDEMRKISTFLGLIDKLVDDQKKMTEEYKKLKKHYLNLIFK